MATMTDANVPGPRAPGMRFGRYVLLVPIGSGGMAQVWMAEHAADHAFRRIVALKLIRSEHAGDATFRRMFLTEARVAGRVSHANVVEVIDLGEEDAQLYQVMEYVEGDSFSQLLARERSRGAAQAASPPISIVCRIVADALRGLHAAHEAIDDEGAVLGFIHRDVSPQNILIGCDGVARIADFGIAKLLGAVESDTQAGQVKGKPGYMSPEQAGAGVLDRRSDLYAMGIVAWEGVTGRRFQASIHAAAPRTDVDEPVAHAIARALAIRPDDRFATAADMADAIEATGACASTKQVADWVTELAGGAIEAKRNEARRVARLCEARGTSEAPKDDSPLAHRTTIGVPIAAVCALAVLPFRYRGPTEDEYLGDAFGDEVIDVLSQTPGLRVFASVAVAKFRAERDPKTVRASLAADVIVDGTLQRTGSQLRVGVRLIDATTGVQTWSESFTGGIEDCFRLQETMGRRIAEALRVELSVRSTGGVVPAEAVELCLRARRRLREFRLNGADGAIDLLERSLALAPRLAPALAAHAIASVHAWFVPNTGSTAIAEERARRAVARALEEAPGLAESHYAGALLALHVGDFEGAVAKLGSALGIAPHSAEALTSLGAIECETGLGERGLARLELAWEISPSVVSAYALAYDHALHGRTDAYEAVMARSVDLRDATGLIVLEMRVASWRGDDARIGRAMERLHPTSVDRERFETYGRALLGEVSRPDADAYFERVIQRITNGRMRTFLCQLATEVFARQGHRDLASVYLERGAAALLIDVEWVDHCPVLATVRDDVRFREARDLVSRRARSLRVD